MESRNLPKSPYLCTCGQDDLVLSMDHPICSKNLTCDNFDLAERLGEGPPWGCDSVLWKPCGVLGAGGPWGSRPAPWWCRWCPMLSYWLCWANMAASRSPMLTAPIPPWIFCIFWIPAPPLAAAPLGPPGPRLPSAEAGNGTPWP